MEISENYGYIWRTWRKNSPLFDPHSGTDHLQTMGYGLPSAIGAKVAAPEKTVVDIDGDASFSMTAMELATAAQYDIGVKVIILNNEFQGMVQQWQGP